MSHPTFARSLRAIAADPVGRALLSLAGSAELATLATYLASADPYNERAQIDAALARARRPDSAVALLAHQLWCAHREAAWRLGRLEPAALEDALAIEGEHWVAETAGHPTVLVSPMTTALSDASWVITRAIRLLAPERRMTLYGDGIESGDIGVAEVDARMAGNGLAALRAIVGTLASGGVFCTYADFVYQGHEAVRVELFGGLHSISSAFVGLASRPDTMLLPCLVTRGVDETLRCRFWEPTLVTADPGSLTVAARTALHSEVAQLIGRLLEQLIAEAPEQWLLLPTLSYDSPQMERT